jgi:hypothetical protein
MDKLQKKKKKNPNQTGQGTKAFILKALGADHDH